jgi:histidine ammonia-lyase
MTKMAAITLEDLVEEVRLLKNEVKKLRAENVEIRYAVLARILLQEPKLFDAGISSRVQDQSMTKQTK